MPSGQYFNSNPQAAAIASNLAKVFFGDAEARAEQARMEGIALENQLRQQQIDENNTVNDARGSISRLFGNMSPADVQKNAPQFYSEFARLAGRDGFGANDGSTLIRGFAANAGADDQTVARAFVGAGNGLGTNEGVSIADRNAVQKRQLAPQYYNANLDDKRMRDLHTVTVNDPDATVYSGGKTFTASPQAVQNAKDVNAARPSGSRRPTNVSPAMTMKMSEILQGGYDGAATLSPDDQMAIIERASEYYQMHGNVAKAIQQSVDELTQDATQKGYLWDTPGMAMKPDAGISSAFVPTPDSAVTAAANGAAPPPSPATTNVDQKTAIVSPGQPGSSAENAIPFDGAGTLTPGLFYMRNGAVRQYMGGPVREPTSWKRAQ